jgi:hypothetical protein
VGVVTLLRPNYQFLTPKEKFKVTFNTFMGKMNGKLPQKNFLKISSKKKRPALAYCVYRTFWCRNFLLNFSL